MPYALGKADNNIPIPSTNQVSLASQKGPMEATFYFIFSVVRDIEKMTQKVQQENTQGQNVATAPSGGNQNLNISQKPGHPFGNKKIV